jgi:hypothetical protein
MQFTEHCNLESILQGLSSSSSDGGRALTPVYNREGNYALAKDFWIAIVQNADSSPLFDDLDAALQRGSSEKIAALRQVADLSLREADRSNEQQIGVFDGVLVQLIDGMQTSAPVAKAPVDLALIRARYSGAGFSERRLVRSA